MNTNLSSLVEKYQLLCNDHDGLVLATIVETMGSTYRKAGARMIITPEATFFGLLGGGCFEADLLAHSDEVFKSRQNKIVFYDMRAPEDEIWGLGLGCNGAVRILLQFVPADGSSEVFKLLQEALESDQKHVLLSVCKSSHQEIPEASNSLFPINNTTTTVTSSEWTEDVKKQVQQTGRSGVPLFKEHELDGEKVSLFTCEINPPFHFMVIGAGPDAEPIIRFARELGWKVSLVDYRESFLNQECFSSVENIIHSDAIGLGEHPVIREVNAIVVMTHKIEQDELYLKSLVKTSAQYIGLLGPRARRERLLDSLGNDVELLQSRIFGPVGLDIGGEAPEEIALSLVAEIQANHYGRNAQSLNSKDEPLHGAAGESADSLYAVVLAAGEASRFGGLKQTLEYQGMSLLRRSVIAANAVVDKRVKVVLGARAQKITREIESLDAGIVHNNDWESGMASSIKAGIESLPDSCDAIMLILCDQALVGAEQLQQLRETWIANNSKIVAASFSGTIGAPVIIPRTFFPDILKLSGDRGAKPVIERNIDQVQVLEMPEAEFDIDTQEDYMRLLSQI